METINSQVLETLKCPNCSNYMTELIYECVSGHSVCDACSASEKCPTCKGGITDIRNHTLEKLSNIVFFPCIYNDFGCNRQMKFKELKEHIPFCDYRGYVCILDEKCEWEGSKHHMKKHSLEKHEMNVIIGRECVRFWNASKPDQEVHLIMAYNEQFYIHRKLKDGIMYWTVQYIGRPEDIILFCYQIFIFTDQYKNRSLLFSETCHDDIEEDVDDIIGTGFCVAVPVSVLETYMNMEGVVFYRIRIKRV